VQEEGFVWKNPRNFFFGALAVPAIRYRIINPNGDITSPFQILIILAPIFYSIRYFGHGVILLWLNISGSRHPFFYTIK